MNMPRHRFLFAFVIASTAILFTGNASAAQEIRIGGSGGSIKALLASAISLAVTDVVEAMCSHRPYRPAPGIEAALAEIERGRGTVYDPVVADACLKLFREKSYTTPAYHATRPS